MKIILGFLTVTLLTGCSTWHSVTGCEPVPHYNRTQVASFTSQPAKVECARRGTFKPYGSVAFYESAAAVGQPYKAVGVLTVGGEPQDEARFITAFLYRAADLNADAIIMERGPAGVYDTTTGGGHFGGPNGSVGWNSSTKAIAVFRAQAIQYTHESRSDHTP